MIKNKNADTNKKENKSKGNFIESLAAAYLRRLGYEILARNYAYRGGELDIVAKDGNTIVFVEVKSVWNNQQGNPAARVNRMKQQKIWRTACHYLQENRAAAPKGFDQPCRFDVLSARVYQKPLQFSHLKNAFEGTQVIPQC
ncbi:MAG: YraN family protein [Fibrobacter sp.]|nr:YraN family protein [Fibrobacter sp.]